MDENSNSVHKSLRDNLSPNKSITLTKCGATDTRTFDIIEELGNGGTVIAYKVKYDSADTNRYMYVLKEVYPMPSKQFGELQRSGKAGLNLEIDKYDVSYYQSCRSAFEDAYHLQNEMANGNDKVLNVSTSLPIGLYEDKNSSKNGTYALYGLFQYSAGETLNKHEESSLLELIDIQRKIAEVVKAYHNKRYLWLDIKETNVNVVGAGTVQTVSMFDFGSLISMDALAEYTYDGDEPNFLLSFSRTSNELLLPFELECLMEDSGSDKSNKRFVLADPMNVAQNLNVLGLYGRSTDIFLLGSLLFKRLYGAAPTIEACTNIQDGTFDITSSAMLRACSDKVKDAIYSILKKTLNYEDIEMRYETADELVEAYNEVHKLINTDMVAQDIQTHIKQSVDHYSDKYNFTVLTAANGKFARLKALSDRRFKNFVTDDDNPEKFLTPFEAIDKDRLVFFYGDGGIGKSTSMFDFMKKSTAITIYIELSRYRYIENQESFILRTIIDEICNNFADSTGYDKSSYDFPRALKDSFKECPTGIPEYIIILDGYNEISNEMRGYFDYEMKIIYDKWKNVRFIVTGRTLPVGINGKLEELYLQFKRFKFTGVSDNELKCILETEQPKHAERILRDKKLFEVLHIPMFLGMFLHLQVDTDVSVHTRGEILDQFVMKTERDVAEYISGKQHEKTDLASKRLLLVLFSLPFVANYMDKNKLFSIVEKDFLDKIACGNLLFLTTYAGEKLVSVYDSFTIKYILKSSAVFDDSDFDKQITKIERQYKGKKSPDYSIIEKRAIQNIITKMMIYDILIKETGYCYIANDGSVSFIHQYYRDYFAAKHIQNILDADQTMDGVGLTKDEQLQFTKDYGLDYTWSDNVCILLGEIIGDYKNEPGYTEE